MDDGHEWASEEEQDELFERLALGITEGFAEAREQMADAAERATLMSFGRTFAEIDSLREV